MLIAIRTSRRLKAFADIGLRLLDNDAKGILISEYSFGLPHSCTSLTNPVYDPGHLVATQNDVDQVKLDKDQSDFYKTTTIWNKINAIL